MISNQRINNLKKSDPVGSQRSGKNKVIIKKRLFNQHNISYDNSYYTCNIMLKLISITKFLDLLIWDKLPENPDWKFPERFLLPRRLMEISPSTLSLLGIRRSSDNSWVDTLFAMVSIDEEWTGKSKSFGNGGCKDERRRSRVMFPPFIAILVVGSNLWMSLSIPFRFSFYLSCKLFIKEGEGNSASLIGFLFQIPYYLWFLFFIILEFI